MDELSIKGTRWTPTITGNCQAELSIQGESQSEDAVTFYAPVFDWIRQTLEEKKQLTVILDLKYFNTSTVKILQDIFDTLNDAYKLDCAVRVNWCLQEDEDIDIVEKIEDFQEDYEFPIVAVEM